MEDFGRALIIFFAAINPAAALLALDAAGDHSRSRRSAIAALAAVAAFALLAFAAVMRQPLLDALDASGESFEVAAAVVMVVAAARPLLTGRAVAVEPRSTARWWSFALAPLAVPALAGPAALAAAVVYVERYDAAPALAAAAVVLALTAAASATTQAGTPALTALARVTAVLLVFVAFALAVDAVRSV